MISQIASDYLVAYMYAVIVFITSVTLICVIEKLRGK